MGWLDDEYEKRSASGSSVSSNWLDDEYSKRQGDQETVKGTPKPSAVKKPALSYSELARKEQENKRKADSLPAYNNSSPFYNVPIIGSMLKKDEAKTREVAGKILDSDELDILNEGLKYKLNTYNSTGGITLYSFASGQKVPQNVLDKFNTIMQKVEYAKQGTASKMFERAGRQAVATGFGDKSPQQYAEAAGINDAGKVGNVVSDIAGTIAGYSVPTGGAGPMGTTAMSGANLFGQQAIRDIGVAAPKLLKSPLAQKVAQGLFENIPLSIYSGVVEGQSPGEVAKTYAEQAPLVVGGELLFHGLGKGLSKIKGAAPKKAIQSTVKDAAGAVQDVAAKVEKPALKATSPEGKFTIKNKGWLKAAQDYNDAVTKIQNHFRTNELRSDEIPLIKSELGIDMDEIISRMEKYETKSSRQLLDQADQISKSRRAAGLASDKTYDVMDAVKKNKSAVAKGEPAKVEAWQMTKDEWTKSSEPSTLQAAGKATAEGIDLQHKTIVEDALKQNKPVPRPVAEEYPDLIKRYKVDVNNLPAEAPGIMASAKDTESLVKKKIELPFEEGKGVEMVKRSDIEKFISESLDIPVAQGKFRQKAYGIFKVKPKVIRLKQAKDIETLYHETGHFLDDKLKLRNQGFDEELMNLGQATSLPSYSEDTVKAEGVAEFMRHYLVDPVAAKKTAPKFYDYFEGILKKDTRLDGMMKTLQQATENYIKQDPQTRLMSNVSIGKGGFISRLSNAKESVSPEKIYSMSIDELKPLQRVVDEITGGVKISSSENPFELAWLNRGWQGRAEAFLRIGRVDKNFKKVGKSFDEILKPVKKQINDFRAYIIAKRAKELMDRDIETGMMKSDIEATLSRHANKEYDKVMDELVAYQDDMLNELVNTGVLSKDAVASMKELNKEYIPFNRVIEQFKGKAGAGKGFQAYSPVKGIKGSTRDVVDPLESIIKNTYVTVNLAERNRVGKSLVELGEKFEGIGKFFDKVPPKMMGQTVQLKDIEKALRNAGADTSTIDLEQVANIFRPTRYTGKDNIITVFREGKPEYYEVFDESLYRSMLALDRESTNILLKVMSYPAKLLRSGATLTPDFVARNPLRDAMSAFVYSKYGFFPGVDTARGLFHAIKKDDVYLKWVSSGGANSMFVSLDRDYLQKNLRGILKTSLKDKTLNIITHPVDVLRAFSEFTEVATRLGEFGKGLKKEGMTADGIRKAALASRDITLDFARGGTFGKQANKVVAFFNASLQGTDKLIRSFSPEKIDGKLNWSRPLKSTTKALASITLPSVALYMLNKDDPRYQELPQWQKDTFWIILGKEKIYRIPKPFELGVIFGTIPERILQWTEGNDPTALNGLADRLKETFVPDYLPTAFLPIVEAISNYSFFKGTNIVPDSEKNDQPWTQYSAYTSETAKLLGKALNQSPRIIENTISGYGGGAANYTVDAVDVILKAAGLVKAKKLPKATIEEFPLFKGFMVKAYQSADSIDDFYTELNKLEGEYTAAKDSKKLFPNMPKLKLMRNQSQQLSKIRKKVNSVYESDKYTREQKLDMVNQYMIEMVNAARAGLGKEAIKEDKK